VTDRGPFWTRPEDPSASSGQNQPGPVSGGYYYPPGTTPGANQPRGPERPRPRSVNPRAWLWVAIGVAVVALLFHAHRIDRVDVVLFCTMIPSIILHEVAHGWVALAFGDDTAKRAGRLTLNPLAHVDILGTIIVPILMIWGGIGFFGWAKPVPVNVSKLRSPRNHGVLVSLAGPAVNAFLVVLSAVLFHAFGGIGALEADPNGPLWVLILIYLGLVNLWLFVFNMLPIPPLDGSVLVERMLPGSWWPRYLQLRRYTMPLVLVVVVLGTLIPDGNTTLIGHFANSTVNWWLSLLGVG
jgi:Zn-dependent protease